MQKPGLRPEKSQLRPSWGSGSCVSTSSEEILGRARWFIRSTLPEFPGEVGTRSSMSHAELNSMTCTLEPSPSLQCAICLQRSHVWELYVRDQQKRGGTAPLRTAEIPLVILPNSRLQVQPPCSSLSVKRSTWSSPYSIFHLKLQKESYQKCPSAIIMSL